MLRMVVVDDDEPMRRGLKEMLELQPGWEVVGEAANGREALEMADRLNPDVVTLDISMPVLDGISTASLIHQAHPETEMLVLSQHDLPEMVRRALNAGVRGYVLKSRAGRDLVPAVEAVCHHTSFVSAEVSGAEDSKSDEPGKEAVPATPLAGQKSPEA
jgi:DNA-binding NarL/FixJ family response regulator